MDLKRIFNIATTLIHTIFAILVLVMVYDIYAPQLKNDHRFDYDPYHWFALLVGTSFLPAIQMIVWVWGSWYIDEIFFFFYITCVIWGFVIIFSNDWKILRNDYIGLHNFVICYQITFFYLFSINCYIFHDHPHRRSESSRV